MKSNKYPKSEKKTAKPKRLYNSTTSFPKKIYKKKVKRVPSMTQQSLNQIKSNNTKKNSGVVSGIHMGSKMERSDPSVLESNLTSPINK